MIIYGPDMFLILNLDLLTQVNFDMISSKAQELNCSTKVKT